MRFWIILCLLLSGCASITRNPPLEKPISNNESAYSFNNMLAAGNEIDDNLVILTFSGGGTRAGALAYGACMEGKGYSVR